MTSSKPGATAVREAPVDSLPFVGKSWRKRGALYWAGRTLVVFFVLLMTSVVCGIAVGITMGIVSSGVSPWVIVPIMVVLSVASSVYTGRSIVRKQQEQATAVDEHSPGARKRGAKGAGATGGAVGAVLGALGGLGALLLAVCAPIAVGVFPIYLWYWLKPLAPGELRARRKLTRWLTLQGRRDEVPAGWDVS